MAAFKNLTPLAAAILAAREFKQLLDVQPAGSLFNPGGNGDARTSATYAYASLLLAEASPEGRQGGECPDVMHLGVVSVVDVVADHRAEVSPDLLELLTGVAAILGKLGFQIPGQNGRGGEQAGPIEIGSGIAGNGDVMAQKVKSQLDAIHGTASGKVVGGTLCHGEELVNQLMTAAFDPASARTRRSAAYKAGTRDYLHFKAIGRELPRTSAPGHAEFDAYSAGLDEGRAIWARHQAGTAQ